MNLLNKYGAVCGHSSMAEPQVSTLKMGVRVPLAAPKFIEFGLISGGGKKSPLEYGYHIVPVYCCKPRDHKNNIKWIEESLSDRWSWFEFTGFTFNSSIKPGISYCFKSKIDVGMFALCRTLKGHIILCREN